MRCLDWISKVKLAGTLTILSVLKESGKVEVLMNLSFPHSVVHVDWHYEGSYYAVGYLDGTLKLGSLNFDSNIISVQAHDSSVAYLEWDPKGLFFSQFCFKISVSFV